MLTIVTVWESSRRDRIPLRDIDARLRRRLRRDHRIVILAGMPRMKKSVFGVVRAMSFHSSLNAETRTHRSIKVFSALASRRLKLLIQNSPNYPEHRSVPAIPPVHRDDCSRRRVRDTSAGSSPRGAPDPRESSMTTINDIAFPFVLKSETLAKADAIAFRTACFLQHPHADDNVEGLREAGLLQNVTSSSRFAILTSQRKIFAI